MVKITGVDKHSRAERAGILAGDVLLSINGNEINDVLDYRFYLAERKVDVLASRNGKELSFSIKKGKFSFPESLTPSLMITFLSVTMQLSSALFLTSVP